MAAPKVNACIMSRLWADPDFLNRIGKMPAPGIGSHAVNGTSAKLGPMKSPGKALPDDNGVEAFADTTAVPSAPSPQAPTTLSPKR